MNSKHIALALLFSIYHLAFGIGRVAAQSCTTQYGGTTTCVPTDVTINKQVRDPINMNLFRENITAGDTAYAPGSEVEYKLTVRNGSKQTFTTATVRDILPDQLDFVAGSGTYNTSTRTLTFTITNFTPGQTVTERILARVKDTSAFLPTNQSLFCNIANRADVTAGDRSDNDQASLCVQTKILGATTLPVAGFDDLMIILPFVGTALGGLVLLKKK